MMEKWNGRSVLIRNLVNSVRDKGPLSPDAIDICVNYFENALSLASI
jgi:hypothetical protein